MKKRIIITLSLIPLLLMGCSSSNKYPYEHIGIYDTKTKQYIDIGDSKSKIDNVLGTGRKNTNDFYEYDDVLSIYYDDNDKVHYISIRFDIFSDDDEINERYTLADGTNYTSTVTDFINNYNGYVYNGSLLLPNTCVSVILQNKNKKTVMSKLEDVKELPYNSKDGVYVITVDYTSYDNLSSFDIEKVSFPAMSDWKNFSELEE